MATEKTKWPPWVTGTLGFQPEQLLSWRDLTRLLHRPCDPASLAATRIVFGLLMCLDLPQERGMGMADKLWGDPNLCRFPLFDGMKPPSLPWMMILYGTMVACVVFMTLGWKWRPSCGIFVTCYWYIFLLDKSSWNNHTYLYGLLSTILLFSDPHRCWSVDGVRNPHLRNSHVPLWTYALLRFQVFLLYFYAGIKKIDADWLGGYPMQRLSEHWVFLPFRITLDNDTIDYYIIHLGGFLLDLTLGFILFFDKTRIFGLVFGTMFHLMNSQIFTIGMFPWACMATMPIFCRFSWPRSLISLWKTFLSVLSAKCLVFLNKTKLSSLGINRKNVASKLGLPYVFSKKTQERLSRPFTVTDGAEDTDGKEVITRDESETSEDIGEDNKTESQYLERNVNCCYGEMDNVTWKQRITTAIIIAYVSLQLFLPFSHSITKGYNTWTEGPYGYSWDMMIHSWDTLHIKITAIERGTKEKFYLDPHAWVRTNRWTSQADMAVQLSSCIEDRLEQYGINNISLHFDVWRSLNKRFQQRVYDPTVDILQAPWSPWQKTPWVLPVLSEFSPWRGRLNELQQQFSETSVASDVIFIADFPGLMLENFLNKDLSNTTLEVLRGEVAVLFKIPLHDNYCSSHGSFCDELNNAKVMLLANDTNLDQGNKDIIKTMRLGYSPTKQYDKSKPVTYKISLKEGEKMPLPQDAMHKVITTSGEPSSYMYTFVNSTLEKIILEGESSLTDSDATQMDGDSKTCKKASWWFSELNPLLKRPPTKETNDKNNSNKDSKEDLPTNASLFEFTSDLPAWKDFVNFLAWKSEIFARSALLLGKAIIAIFTGKEMEEI